MNAYLAEVVKKQRADAELRQARKFALKLIDAGKLTLEEIADVTGLALEDVRRLADKS
ncbi:MAG: hypothetical protein IJG34_04575 [Synergistaceae bacterium]|nr:hypothetical protein [Synergistaceae bacterium]MBQ3449153.1 hypothetical protein [Synergistaceae bacterium]MBQ6111168.1 hypothetical protein [Synergistaceae bacterium]MBQ9628950.1 hypothetical protein [Synergistaceae bacterium]MBR0251205.1 hypothetical protein [Synergistaceae bacterium]